MYVGSSSSSSSSSSSASWKALEQHPLCEIYERFLPVKVIIYLFIFWVDALGT